MGAVVGQPLAPLALLLDALADRPWDYDYFAALRAAECASDKPRLGYASSPHEEPIRIGQDPSLEFAPTMIQRVDRDCDTPQLMVNFTGLLGVNSPLPKHIVDIALREANAAEPKPSSLVSFINMLQNRFYLFLYRAWAQANPVVSRDRLDDDPFARYFAAFAGYDTAKRERRRTPLGGYGTTKQERRSTPLAGYDAAEQERQHTSLRVFFSGLLTRSSRSPDGLVATLRAQFAFPISFEPFIGQWLNIPQDDLARLVTGGNSTMKRQRECGLGRGTVLGKRVWDRQHKFRLRLGPMKLREYESLLPSASAENSADHEGNDRRRLVSWIQEYVNLELDWEAQLVVAPDEESGEIAPWNLPLSKAKPRLGWTSWLRAPDPHGANGHLLRSPAYAENQYA